MAQDRGSRGGKGQPSINYTAGVRANELAETLSDLARSLQDERDVDDTLTAIVSAAVHTVPGTRYAGITVVQARRAVETRAASDELVRKVDEAQYDTGQGPCLDATWVQQTVRLTDMAAEQRWPEFTRRAAHLGVRSMLSFQLFVTRDNLGALNLYSDEPEAFTDESEYVGLLFAAHAAVALVGAQQHQSLTLAVSMRDLIGQAKGILMERHRISADQAFELLVRASQRTNTKLAEIARVLTETGELPRPGKRR
ncbi:GAF and ANTAR domain-containing protein [Actinoplanes sp. NBC_00393]|uniref:GAF and ANTAR domain-containing protein n=1 Tax=Actinoplanes sp. NBC_00393 TaxID=2975953 RepID=UPI002E1A19B5